MKRAKLLIFILINLFFLAGCGSAKGEQSIHVLVTTHSVVKQSSIAGTSTQTNDRVDKTPVLTQNAIPCPAVISDRDPSLLPDGTLYFYIWNYSLKNENGIWGYKNNQGKHLFDKMLYDFHPEKMLGIIWPSNELTLYNLGKGNAEQTYKLDHDISRYFGETDDGFFFSYFGQPETFDTINIEDIVNLKPESDNKFKVTTINLPDFVFYKPYDGFASFAKNQKLVLYSAQRNETIEYVILYDYEKEQILWETQKMWGQFQPVWSQDGKSVFMVLYNNDRSFYSIYRLDVDTLQLTDLVPNNPEFKNSEASARFDVSPQQRYLYLGWFGNNQEAAPGFILDTRTNQMRQICVAGKLFNTGMWVNNHLFVYDVYDTTKLEDTIGANPTELWIVDVDTWKTQHLFTTGKAGIDKIYGWVEAK